MGVSHGAFKDRKTWSETRESQTRELGYKTQPYVLIVGGGQGGIGLGARLRRLGVPTIIIEKNDRPGDSWRKRYKSLCLHDPVWYDHLPYLPFPDDWPVFSPKDKIGDWLESYTKIMELNYWTRTTCQSASYDNVTKQWTVTVDRDGETVVLKPQQLVLATGMSAVANLPDVPGMESFQGDLHHSSKHPGPDAYSGKKAVVVGSNNSAHDISAALWEAGALVTMVQRSSTHIVKSNTLMEIGLGDLYSEKAIANGITTDIADLIFASLPYKAFPAMQVPVYQAMKERDADFYERLEKAGFLLDWGTDGSGLFVKYLRRGSGYYIDVGASELVADGKIKLAQGQVVEVQPNGLKLENGTELSADVIIFATGYTSMNGWAASLIIKTSLTKLANAGDWDPIPPKTPDLGRANCATCGNPLSRKHYGSTAAICTSRGIIPNSCRCSLKHGWKRSQRRFTDYKRCIIWPKCPTTQRLTQLAGCPLKQALLTQGAEKAPIVTMEPLGHVEKANQ
jgi:putative flavoprotein involved in K+ transport